MKRIEIIVPCYNEEDCIFPLMEKCESILADQKEYIYSILFVNDGSRDGTLETIKKAVSRWGSDKVNYISFSRNFGKEAAMFAGLSRSTGELVVLMDADLQHPPELIPKMWEAIEKEGYDCCGARRINRKGEPLIRSGLSRLFYKVTNKITGIEMVSGGSDYRMLTRKVVDVIVTMEERERFTKGLLAWVGFDTKWIEYENVERVAGTTKWSFGGLLRYAVNGIMAFATTPLRAAIYLGFLIDGITFVYALYVIIGVLSRGSDRSGFATIIILIMFFGGTIILLLGVIGEYLARIYMESKKRPIYIVDETNLNKKGKQNNES